MKTTKTKKIEQIEAQQILTSAKELKLNTVVEELGNFQVNIQNSLANLSASLTGKIQQLKDVETAIQLSEQRLKELYEIEKEAIKLDEIKNQVTIEQTNLVEVQTANSKDLLEMTNERNKKWQREEEDHKYNMDLLRRKTLDDHNTLTEKNKRDEAIRQAELNKNWTERDAKLQAQESEVASCKKQIADFPTLMKNKETEITNAMTTVLGQKHSHEMAMLKKDFEAQKALNDAKVGGMNDLIGKLEAQVDELNKQVAVSRQDAKEIASQALQSTGSAKTIDALQKAVESKNDNSKK